MTAPILRKPTEEDFRAWMDAVHQHYDEIDLSETVTWNDMALGFLVARGVDFGFTDWELLSSFSCGDLPRMRKALIKIEAMVEPRREEAPDEDEDEEEEEEEEEEDEG